MIESVTALLTREMTIGQIVTTYPATRAVILKYFHGGCHHCPSQHVEPLWLAARMYGLNLETLISEMHEVIRSTDQDSMSVPLTTRPMQTPSEKRLARDRARGLIY